MNFILSLIKDDSKRLSLNKTILFIVAASATLFMWKLVIQHELTVEYFITYLAFGSGHTSLNKFLDKVTITPKA